MGSITLRSFVAMLQGKKMPWCASIANALPAMSLAHAAATVVRNSIRPCARWLRLVAALLHCSICGRRAGYRPSRLRLKPTNCAGAGLAYDTVEANLKLGYGMDLREYGLGAQILADLGLKTISLMTNNPRKVVGLEGYGLKITEQVPIRVKSNPHNERYLKTKREKLGHLL